MDVEFSVNLIELKRAFRRLSARLPDESEVGSQFVVFNACSNNLEIAARGTSEGLAVSVLHPGQASLPFPVFSGIARVLRFYRRKTVDVGFSNGVVKIEHTQFRHSWICALPSDE
jgi:hypothetical protein